MKIFELLTSFSKNLIFEGGNLELPNPEDPSAPHRADEIDLKVHNRAYMVKLLDKLLHDIDAAFKAQTGKHLWNPQLLASKQFLGGSALHFFNTSGISDEQFIAKKPKVGDIDTQCNKELESEITEFLTANTYKQIGDAVFLGFGKGNAQLNGLFQFKEPPIKVQIDFEFGAYNPTLDIPDEWFRFSHSSEWNDIEAGIKGVFHKYLYRALPVASGSEKYIVKYQGRGKNRAPVISPEPKKTGDYSFAVSSKQGGGLSKRFKPFEGDPKEINGIPVMIELPSEEKNYVQQLPVQFKTLFGVDPTPEDTQLQKSFIGTLELMNKYLDDAQKYSVISVFLKICFAPGTQMITRDDPKRDFEIKFAAIDKMLETVKTSSTAELRQKAVSLAKAYEDDYHELEAFKKANPELKQPRAELRKRKEAAGILTPSSDEDDISEEVATSKRVGVPHLSHSNPKYALTDFEFLDLLEELKDHDGRFRLNNIKMTEKVDGAGGRFGKDPKGRPFFESSSSGPKFSPGDFEKFTASKTQDQKRINVAKLYDDITSLFTKPGELINQIDEQLGKDFLVNKKVHCEILFNPLAQEDPITQRLKFVKLSYDKAKLGSLLTIVPLFVEDATSNVKLPELEEEQIKSAIAHLPDVFVNYNGEARSVKFIDNKLEYQKGVDLDITEIIDIRENIDVIRDILMHGNSTDKFIWSSKLQLAKNQLDKYIQKHPSILGRGKLGSNYEGTILYPSFGPVKVTSPEFRAKMQADQLAKRGRS